MPLSDAEKAAIQQLVAALRELDSTATLPIPKDLASQAISCIQKLTMAVISHKKPHATNDEFFSSLTHFCLIAMLSPNGGFKIGTSMTQVYAKISYCVRSSVVLAMWDLKLQDETSYSYAVPHTRDSFADLSIGAGQGSNLTLSASPHTRWRIFIRTGGRSSPSLHLKKPCRRSTIWMEAEDGYCTQTR